MKIKLIYLYPSELNLYGDRGNIEILANRAKKRGIEVEIIRIGALEKMTSSILNSNSILFMGGGPDSGQKTVYDDLIKDKSSYIKEFIELGGAALFICGSYQLMGKYYKSADGVIIDGISIFDFYTSQHKGAEQRCVGNIVCTLNEALLKDKAFLNINFIGKTIVGFENHGGRTYLGKDITCLGNVVYGYGNNGEDMTEGIFYKNTIGTYLHGPLLSKNPHIADFLIAKALKAATLQPIDDDIINKAHSALIRKYK